MYEVLHLVCMFSGVCCEHCLSVYKADKVSLKLDIFNLIPEKDFRKTDRIPLFSLSLDRSVRIKFQHLRDVLFSNFDHVT